MGRRGVRKPMEQSGNMLATITACGPSGSTPSVVASPFQPQCNAAVTGWDEGRSEPERFIVAGDKIIVFVHARARLKDRTEWHEKRSADAFTFPNGKAIQVRAFADRRQALEWAGVKSSDAN